MAIMRPPVTGDNVLDSFLDQVAKEINRGTGGDDGVTIEDVERIASSIRPTNSATLVLYIRHNSDILPIELDIDVQTTYNYKEGTLTDNTTSSIELFDGWTRNIPDVSEGDYLFAIQVNIADTSNLEVIDAEDWSEPVLILQQQAPAPPVETWTFTSSVSSGSFEYDNGTDDTPVPTAYNSTLTATSSLSTVHTASINISPFNPLNNLKVSTSLTGTDASEFEILSSTVTQYGTVEADINIIVTHIESGKTRGLNFFASAGI